MIFIRLSAPAVHTFLFIYLFSYGSQLGSFQVVHLYLQMMSARGQCLQIVWSAVIALDLPTKTGWIEWFNAFHYLKILSDAKSTLMLSRQLWHLLTSDFLSDVSALLDHRIDVLLLHSFLCSVLKEKHNTSLILPLGTQQQANRYTRKSKLEITHSVWQDSQPWSKLHPSSPDVNTVWKEPWR